jgi:predicted ATPase
VDEIEVPALPTTRSESVLAEEYRYGRLAPDSPEVQLNFRERGAKVAFPASEMASGMLISLALLWLVLRPEADKIICYDEPENSIHPYLLAKVYSLLRGAARGELGRPPVQVLIATHSVDFVNLCEPNEIRICERSDEGIKVTSISDEKDLAEAVNNYRGAMGELWNSGALGGVPHGAKSSRSG